MRAEFYTREEMEQAQYRVNQIMERLLDKELGPIPEPTLPELEALLAICTKSCMLVTPELMAPLLLAMLVDSGLTTSIMQLLAVAHRIGTIDERFARRG